jgi:magnesium-transporting ATPase (P-type)
LGNESNDEKLSMKRHKKNMLFAGTSVIQTRYYTHESVKAVVLRTGFRTSKGELVRAILHPKPAEFRFNTDLYKYILALALIALGGMIFTIVYKIHRKESFQVSFYYTHIITNIQNFI